MNRSPVTTSNQQRTGHSNCSSVDSTLTDDSARRPVKGRLISEADVD